MVKYIMFLLPPPTQPCIFAILALFAETYIRELYFLSPLDMQCHSHSVL